MWSSAGGVPGGGDDGRLPVSAPPGVFLGVPDTHDQSRPLGQELLADLLDQRRVQLLDAGHLAQPGGRLQGVEPGVGEVVDDPDLLDRGAVDLFDLPDQHRHQFGVGQVDREFVDGHAAVASRTSTPTMSPRRAPIREPPGRAHPAGRAARPGRGREPWPSGHLRRRPPRKLPGTVKTSDGSERSVSSGDVRPRPRRPHRGRRRGPAGLSLDRVILVPAGDPWQKRGSVAAPAADRLAMVRAAVVGIEGLEVSPLEVDRDGPSYTYETLESLSGPGRELFLIVGADVAATLSSWVGLERLPGLARLVVVDRAGDRPADPVALPGGVAVRPGVYPRLDVSSTDLRARAAHGWPLDGLVPPGAVRIIRAGAVPTTTGPVG